MTEQQRRDMDKMQADAIRKMKDMNSKSTQNQHQSIPPAPDFLRVKAQNNQPQNKSLQEDTSHPIKQQEVSKGFNLLKMLNFSNFKMDSDFTVIIAMILLLSSEDSDELLLLALLYIMM